MFEVWSLQLVKYLFGDDPRFALLAAFVVIVMIVMYKKTSTKQKEIYSTLNNVRSSHAEGHAEHERRLTDHADFFDLHSDLCKSSNKFSMKAFELSAEAKAGKPITNEDVCIFIEAQNIVETAKRKESKVY